jgi:glycosyltransferase involved in cell wall biosynthesis
MRVGGVQTVVVDLANGQSRRGHSVGIAADDGELWNEVDSDVVRLEGIRSGRGLGLVNARRALASQDWDIVHTHQRGVSTAVWLARKGLDVRHVEHVHSLFLPTSHARVSFKGEVLISCGPAVTRMLNEAYGRPSELIHTVLNGVADHGRRARAASRRPGSVVLTNIARVTDVKDPERFLRIVGRLREAGLNAVGRWVGGGEMLDHMRREVVRLGMTHAMEFVGPQRPATAWLEDTDIFLSTSRREGLPLSLVEACAAGLPLVAPNVGSISAIVRDGENGSLYDVALPDDAVAETVLDLAGRIEDLATLGQRSREIYEQDFSLGRVLDEVDAVYEQLVGHAKSAAAR